eukprot:CAMPEP_0206034878 /NCGR_PEP_ID=MMETSP1466-20131121/1678_1 /ASSEMBLY_ACC=CAM_ASM_001126 /TAXON_ID=44452 /ORGANISM="Pavlova gyrans, Strain CCMP608" /LENGTH=276 /DNA_ID=CAMNT_0053409205 /DNA_START=39 /DNA_END=871 /DNA_ORIENTATION=-
MFAVLALSATAFSAGPMAARASAPVARCNVQAKADNMVGACAPLGYFDPLGLSKNAEKAMYYREAELKHGRIAMFATFGWLTTSTGFHPLLDALGLPAGPTPLAEAGRIPAAGWTQIAMFIGAVEGFTWLLKKQPGYKPGDLLGASEYMEDSDLGWQRFQLAELNNGRLAMFAIMGLIAESALFGHPLLGLKAAASKRLDRALSSYHSTGAPVAKGAGSHAPMHGGKRFMLVSRITSAMDHSNASALAPLAAPGRPNTVKHGGTRVHPAVPGLERK